MASGNTIALQAATLLEEGNGSGDVFTAYDDVLTSNEWDLFYRELEVSVNFILSKRKFNNIFELKTLEVGKNNLIELIYKGPSSSIDFYMKELIKGLNVETECIKIRTHDGHIILADVFQEVDDLKIGESTYIVKYDETHTMSEEGYDISFEEVEITLGPDATMKNLVDAFAEKTGRSRKEYSFKAFNAFGGEVKAFQKKLRTCCFDFEIELRMTKKEKKPKSPKSPKSTRSYRRSKSPNSACISKSPKSPRSKPVSNPTSVDVDRLYTGRSTKKSDAYSVKEIKSFLKERGLKQVGKKEELVERLRNNL